MTTINYAREYGGLHRKGSHIFPGDGIMPHVDKIANLVSIFSPERILDYGCGKGFQYKVDRVHMRWGGKRPVLYDVGYRYYQTKPTGVFQGIICTEVLEHIAEEDLDAVLQEIGSYIDPEEKSFIFFSICCRAARKVLPKDRTVHLTIKDPTWWTRRIEQLSRPGLRIVTTFMT